jgi:flavorubredoxin
MFSAEKINDSVYWVGVIDWNLRNFHGYLTQRGSTYNAYLIMDEKITLIDNVKAHFFQEMLERISSVIDPARIDYVVQNHVEMDHSGSLPLLMKHCPSAKVIASKKGVEGLREHYAGDYSYHAVSPGEKLQTGSRTLSFIPTPMVHWPDNMVCYDETDNILFSNDSFGQHLASSQRFDDEFPLDIAMDEAAKYYANIVFPYSRQVKKELEAVKDLPVDMICPSHGLIWRKNVSAIVDNYKKWAHNETQNTAVVVYDTMWGSTEKLAGAALQAFNELGIQADLCNVQAIHRSDIMTKLLDARYICVGSPTLNNNMLPTIAAFLTYLKGLSPRDRTAFSFGSYGWGGQSIAQVHDELEKCGFHMLDPVQCKYVPHRDELEEQKNKIVNTITQYLKE